MDRLEDIEVVLLALTLEKMARGEEAIGVAGLRFMCKEAARMIRRLRPDLAFVDPETRNGG
jgi:hypothetical protein